jgi:hypothetical protein
MTHLVFTSERLGGRGRGPGEFEYLRRIFSAGGDSLAVADGFPNHRINVFRANGDFVRSVRLRFTAEPIGRTADGTFILLQPANYRSPRPTLTPGFHRRSLSIYKLNGEGELTDSLTDLPGREVFVEGGDRIRERAPRLRRHTVVAVRPEGLIVGTQDKASFVELSADLRRRVERQTITQPQSVTAAMRRDWDAARSTMMPNGGVTPVYATEYSPATPAYGDLIAGNDGRVWVQDPELPGSYPLIWTAYSDGRATARVELPIRFFPFEFGMDWVLGVSYDAVGIERVHILNLIPGQHSGRKLSPYEAAPPNTPRCGSWTAR